MGYSIVVQGSLSDPRHIELDEPVTEIHGVVEVILRPARPARPAASKQAPAEEGWEAAFDAWVEGHDRSVPLPRPDSLHREALYEERRQ
jgi:hypothetical protein